ncbi:hypothetical protein J6590_006562 [Homalodisca vitripennis]|nr:hypothetical protein J6590_006562 [Homalodisca vitripennis]
MVGFRKYRPLGSTCGADPGPFIRRVYKILPKEREARGLKGDFRTTTNGQVGGLLARAGSLSGHPSKQQQRSTE